MEVNLRTSVSAIGADSNYPDHVVVRPNTKDAHTFAKKDQAGEHHDSARLTRCVALGAP